MRIRRFAAVLAALTAAASCVPGQFRECREVPPIFPDYVGVTVPEGIAPLTFAMADGRRFREERRREGDTLWITVEAWEKGSREGVRYAPFPVFFSSDPIDPYIAYRLIEPGYESWHDMGIYQRQLSSYREKAIVTNKANGMGCVNCHTFLNGDPDRMFFHARGKGGGTVFADGENTRLFNLAQAGPGRQGTYPAWHPEGRYVAFSSNDTRQCFTIRNEQPIEVYDTASDIILLDLETDSITLVPALSGEDILETFPSWSPDGSRLYYCASDNPGRLPENRGKLRYRLMSIGFENGEFTGEPETVFDCDSLSVSFPRAKGSLLVFTAARFGTFPIWHKEADLWVLDLATGEARRLDEIDSDDTESYHSWSSEGKWMVFSSRRTDGRCTRLFITHCEGGGRFSKPFLLPQRNPDQNTLRLKSYNIPEFIKGESPDRQHSVSALFER